MIIDDRRPTTGDRQTAAFHSMRLNHKPQVSRLKSHLSRLAAGRPLWLRLLLLALAIGALAVMGAAIGRGFAAVDPTPVDVVAVRATSTPATSNAMMPTPAAVASGTPTVGMAAQTLAEGDSAPTVAAKPTGASWPALIEERFELVSVSWPKRTEPRWATGYRDGWFELRLLGRPSISYSNPLRSRDFWIEADVHLQRGQAGLFFLRNKPNDFYRFLIDADGRFRLEWQQVGASQPLIDWSASDALRRGPGLVNRLAVRRVGEELALFANGVQLATYTLPPGSTLEGRIGVALDAPAGQRDGAALFDNLVVRVPPK
jgi:hypothetical protein